MCVIYGVWAVVCLCVGIVCGVCDIKGVYVVYVMSVCVCSMWGECCMCVVCGVYVVCAVYVGCGVWGVCVLCVG